MARHALGTFISTLIALIVLTFTAESAHAACAQPVTGGSAPTASDCLYILNAAVGSQQCDPECECDPNGSGAITASDALTCLAKAVGQDVALACPCAVTSTTTTTILLPTCGFFANGDLELPVSTSGQNGWNFANVEGVGWQASGGNPDGYFTLNASGQLATDPTLSQTVEGLVGGATYRISGDYRSFAAGFGNPDKPDAFAVTVDPQPSDHESIVVLGLPRPSPTATDWTEFSATFVASDETATVSFIAERDGDDSSFDVDNLCLTLEE
jgi:hypothetical protein